MSFIVQALGLSLNVCSCCLAEAGVRLKKHFCNFKIVSVFVDLLKKYFNKLIYFFCKCHKLYNCQSYKTFFS